MDPSDGHRNSSFSVIVLVNIAGVDANLQKEPLLSVPIWIASEPKIASVLSFLLDKIKAKEKGMALFQFPLDPKYSLIFFTNFRALTWIKISAISWTWK